ncbi:short-chain dehydrogenase [Rhodococcus sp. 05-2254-6]|uniref:SDR family NAD(P)-dependent oxidoreductase n=1 Tax=Rhodococcus sp. 05-2254-6 TaxID=2022489 RepID=UPI000B9C3D6D|nr:SDR family oxidoreductase [Rhodococcus sp. 05-2254-6]OZE26834.1 short-chain dehydrogenase [Rhodococcus sp. 05-2254-6]
MLRFEGRTVVVTGAGSGIGAATSARLIDEGATVVVVDVTQEAVDAAIANVSNADRVHGAVLDVCDHAAAVNLLDTTRQKLGGINGLVNCAGITGAGTIVDLDPEAHRKIMSVNLDGTINMCQAFVLAVKDAQGPRAIVNISSGAGILGVPNRLSYVASKFAISGITKSMCPELGPLGIRVNAVAPGMTRTPLTDYMMNDPVKAAPINAKHPIGRIGYPEEIAAAIVFLLSDDASFMTGSVVSVDGGQTACL